MQSSALLLILVIFNYYAWQVTREINQLIELADTVDLTASLDSQAHNLNQSRKAAMKNVWI